MMDGLEPALQAEAIMRAVAMTNTDDVPRNAAIVLAVQQVKREQEQDDGNHKHPERQAHSAAVRVD